VPDKHCGRKFDTASFFGGMVLAFGVVLIVLFGWKFFKSSRTSGYQKK
jgi:hypothetical protein